MSESEIDLTSCDKEPIHLLGKIQSFGYLLSIDFKKEIINYASQNLSALLPVQPTEILGKNYTECLETLPEKTKKDLLKLISIALQKEKSEFERFLDLYIDGEHYYFIYNFFEDNLIISFEKVLLKENLNATSFDSLIAIKSSASTQQLYNNAVSQIRKMIDYDRVMIYQFLDDGTGMVIAEDKETNLESLLDLHYPESDIPKQARELYKKNEVRIISDVFASDISILSKENKPLDLTMNVQRAVSPIHIQYLKNMKLGASFSVSLIVNDQLWGLITCHNHTPKHIDYRIRFTCKYIANIISSFIYYKSQEESLKKVAEIKDALATIQINLLKDNSILQSLDGLETNLLGFVNAEGMAFCIENEIKLIGQTPDAAQVKALQKWIIETQKDNLFHVRNLQKIYPEAAAFSEKAVGIMSARLAQDVNDMLICFRPEYIRQIKWAGKPEKIISINNNTSLQEISPRKSFEIWSQLVKDSSKIWKNEEKSAAKEIARIILETSHKKSAELNELNKKLKAAYAELDTFAYTVSHDLKNPLTVIKTNAEFLRYKQKLSAENQDKNLIETIVSTADKMSFMMNEILNFSRVVSNEIKKSRIDMHKTISEIVTEVVIANDAYESEITIGNTPEILADQVMVYQAFSNIISNAVKYSKKEERPQISIEGYENNNTIVYRIIDNGIGIDIKEHHHVFGLFKRMENAETFHGTGVGLTIVKHIMEKHKGKVWFYSSKNQGAAFYLIFNKQ